jgi:uncharacterized membrane protein YedE/YeeE
MKAILLGIAIASALLFLGLAAGVVDGGHLSVKASYWGVIAGGAILGVGWAISGYCPGTGVAALGDRRKDALYFVLGGLGGALLYMLLHSVLKDTFLFGKILGGKSTLALTPKPSYKAFIDTLPGAVVAIILAFLFGIFACKLPAKSR